MKASTFRGAIFDLDGTLADPLVDISNSMNRVLDYKDNCLNETRLYDGIPEIPDELEKRNIRMAVLSNKAEDFTRPSLPRSLAAENSPQLSAGVRAYRPNPTTQERWR